MNGSVICDGLFACSTPPEWALAVLPATVAIGALTLAAQHRWLD